MSGRRAKTGRRSGNPARAAAQAPKGPAKARTVKRARPSAPNPAASARAARAARGRRRAERRSPQLGKLVARVLSWNPQVGLRGVSGVPLVSLERADAYWAAGTWVLSVILFATVLSSHPGLSDASEAVAGIGSLGILHAPGYPAYVLAGRAFTLIEPFGDMTLRVALFSLLCASLSVVIVQLLARRCGAARWAASVGALALAASAGFWFYAGYTKHDQFSGLMVALAIYLLVTWDDRPTTRRMVGLAAALAFGLGSSWPLTVLLIPAVIFVLARSRRSLSLRSLGLATTVGALLLVGIYGFVMVRASENPPLNWGHATNLPSLVRLIDRSDFLPPSSGSGSGSVAPTSAHASLPSRTPGTARAAGGRGVLQPAAASGSQSVATSGIGAYARMFWRELGIAGFLLAAWGAIAMLLWRRRRVSVPLLLIFLANLLGALVTVAPSSSSYDVDLVEEGFVLGCMFVLAIWAAVGATDLLARISDAVQRGPQAASRRRTAMSTALAALIAGAVLAPLVVVGWPVAHRSDNAYADDFAQTVFSELPRGAALFVWGSDLNLPLTYRQVIYHERPDLAVISLGPLRYDWYRREVSRELGIPVRPIPDTAAGLASVVRAVSLRRPTYVDQQATQALSGQVGYQTVGLVSRVVTGPKPAAIPAQTLETRLLDAERRADMPSATWRVWPNTYLAEAEYASLGVSIARLACEQRDFSVMAQALRSSVAIDPTNTSVSRDLSLLAQHGLPANGQKVKCA